MTQHEHRDVLVVDDSETIRHYFDAGAAGLDAGAAGLDAGAAGLDAGVDDYVKTPIKIAEPLARMRCGERILRLEREKRVSPDCHRCAVPAAIHGAKSIAAPSFTSVTTGTTGNTEKANGVF